MLYLNNLYNPHINTHKFLTSKPVKFVFECDLGNGTCNQCYQ